MKIAAYILVFAVCLPFLAGCGSSASTPDDDQFQKDRAAAAANSKGAPKGTRMMRKPPEIPAKGDTPAATTATTPTTATTGG